MLQERGPWTGPRVDCTFNTHSAIMIVHLTHKVVIMIVHLTHKVVTMIVHLTRKVVIMIVHLAHKVVIMIVHLTHAQSNHVSIVFQIS